MVGSLTRHNMQLHRRLAYRKAAPAPRAREPRVSSGNDKFLIENGFSCGEEGAAAAGEEGKQKEEPQE